MMFPIAQLWAAPAPVPPLPLKVTDALFEIGLSFSDVPEKLHIPYSAIRGFYDPSVNFELEFDVKPEQSEQTADITEVHPEDAAEEPQKPAAKKKPAKKAKKDKAEAEEIIKQLEDGADFAELAKEKSTGPSGPKGGELGYFSKGQMVPEFETAAFALDKGSFTKEPVQTQFGWHVIKVEDKRPQEKPKFEDVAAQLRQQLICERYETVMAELKADTPVEILDPTLEEQPEAK